jgi:hypothetical protein
VAEKKINIKISLRKPGKITLLFGFENEVNLV